MNMADKLIGMLTEITARMVPPELPKVRLADLYAQIGALVDESYCIEMKIWNYRHKNSTPEIEYSIWDGHEHYRAATPEAALSLLVAAYATPDDPLADAQAFLEPAHGTRELESALTAP